MSCCKHTVWIVKNSTSQNALMHYCDEMVGPRHKIVGCIIVMWWLGHFTKYSDTLLWWGDRDTSHNCCGWATIVMGCLATSKNILMHFCDGMVGPLHKRFWCIIVMGWSGHFTKYSDALLWWDGSDTSKNSLMHYCEGMLGIHSFSMHGLNGDVISILK